MISIDAMGCQTQIAQTIVEKGGDYLLAVKDNQETLAIAVRQALTDKAKESHIKIEQGHGRVEAREYHVLPAGKLAEQFPDWIGLKSIGVAIGCRIEKGKPGELEYRYYISSKEMTEAHFSRAVRGHWGIENRLHWVLDASMGEDDCQIYRENAA